jgi:hydrogenase maturation protein HypF
VKGAVQGVGFRPFVYRLATEMGLHGWVNNSPQGVFIEVEGPGPAIDEFVIRLRRDKPAVALISDIETHFDKPAGYESFCIRASEENGARSALILPDLATCPDCLAELFDPESRRYLYPFTNCTNCGPRFTIIEALPYDRPNTTMRGFQMCEQCQAEYDNPLDRRFHAQPNACPRCGPQLQLRCPGGTVLARRHNALLAAADAIRDGVIVAVKGLGGYQLFVDARNAEAVAQLRDRKHREEKPFALMFPSLAQVEEHCHVTTAETALLLSVQSPIVLLRNAECRVPAKWVRNELPRAVHSPFTNTAFRIPTNVAPGNPYLGVMLPYTPLHHILMRELGFPVVATSGNLSDEPICTDEEEALARLGDIADLFLVHDRPIARHADDSVVRVLLGEPTVLRRARGYAPMPVTVSLPAPAPVTLAVGGHLKNSVALSIGRDVFISQHIGDLETAQAVGAFERVIGDFERLYEAQPTSVACDAHPDYFSTQYAQRTGLPVHEVQHHAAHVFSCMAEHGLQGPVLGVSWDGTGYGPDGTVWGGEFLRVESGEWQRTAHLRTFHLPGGDKAVQEPRRSAAGLLYAVYGDRLPDLPEPAGPACTQQELSVWRAMMRRGANAPITSSAGRLFDAVASLLGLRQYTRFEGQAAMDLEFALEGEETDESYPFCTSPAGPNGPLVLDWEPLVRALVAGLQSGLPISALSARFHNTLAEMILYVARATGVKKVALTGGCFQNAYLLEHTAQRLQGEGFEPYCQRQVPPNDGGIALGQIAGALMREGGTI